jgi:subtilase family serine protease
VLLDGFSGIPGGSNMEVALDIDMAIAVAPGLSKVVVYEGFLTNSILAAMASPPSGVPLSAQLSASWIYGTDATSQQLMAQLAAQGQSFFNSSGDDGPYCSDNGDDRDDSDVTIVGGTVLSMNGTGASWQSETTWLGSGGGILTNVAIPGYQATVSMSSNQGSTVHRNLPDVSMVASNVFIFANNGQRFYVGGTSVATPLWAAFIALVNQQTQISGLRPVGFVNPALYAIGQTAGAYQNDFRDIADNSHNVATCNPNGFQAVTGYDLATGWGSPRPNLVMRHLSGLSGLCGRTFASSASQPYT